MCNGPQLKATQGIAGNSGLIGGLESIYTSLQAKRRTATTVDRSGAALRSNLVQATYRLHVRLHPEAWLGDRSPRDQHNFKLCT